VPINAFISDDTYFKKIKDRQVPFKAINFDYQFSVFANYLNNIIKPALDNLINDMVAGSTAPNEVNTFLRNVGDGTTEWASVGGNAINDYSLQFTKLSRCNPSSILAAGNDRALNAITPQEVNQVLISRVDNAPIWQKVTADNIQDRTITGAKVALGSLTNQNFQPDLLLTQLIDDLVTGEKIVDRTINSSKIADGSIDEAILGNLRDTLIGTARDPIQLWGNTIPDGYITIPIMSQYDAVINYTHLVNDFRIPINKWRLYDDPNERVFQYTVIADGAIASYQIAPESLNGSRLVSNLGELHQPYIYYLPRDINDLIADGGIAPENLPAHYRAALGL
jgi:hypothetical protein